MTLGDQPRRYFEDGSGYEILQPGGAPMSMKSPEIADLATALAKAQGQMDGATKNSENPYFKSRYADLASVVEAIRGPFAENGLAYVQCPIPVEGDRVVIETILMHASGQWISSQVDVPVAKGDAQGYGSAITYARRYGLAAMAGVAPEDDDGQAAAKAKPRATQDEMMPKAANAAPRPAVDVGTKVDARTGTWADPKLDPRTGTALPATTTRFTIGKNNYTTAGMTKEQMVQSFDLVKQVDDKQGLGYARTLLADEFKVATRVDLDQATAAKYLQRLIEIAEAQS